MKEDTICDYYQDNKFVRSRSDKRTVYKDKKGRYIKDMLGKHYLYNGNHWKSECWTVKGACTFADVLKEAKQKGEERAKKFEDSGGMCIGCGKNKADPDGFDPMYCKECNADTVKTLNELSKCGGFVGLRVG